MSNLEENMEELLNVEVSDFLPWKAIRCGNVTLPLLSILIAVFEFAWS